MSQGVVDSPVPPLASSSSFQLVMIITPSSAMERRIGSACVGQDQILAERLFLAPHKLLPLLPFQLRGSCTNGAGMESLHLPYRKAAPQAGAKGSLLVDSIVVCL